METYNIKIKAFTNNDKTLDHMHALTGIINRVIQKVENKIGNNFNANVIKADDKEQDCNHIIIPYPSRQLSFCAVCNKEFVMFQNLEEASQSFNQKQISEFSD